MTKKVDTQTFNHLAKDMASYIASARDYHGGEDSYSYPGGVVNGMMLTLYAAYGYETVEGDGEHVEVSVAFRVKERAKELVDDWKKTDEQLNGRYTLAGVDTVVESPYPGAEYRKVGIGDEKQKNVPNTDVLSMIVNGLLVKKEEPVIEYLEDENELRLDHIKTIEGTNLNEASDDEIRAFNEALESIQ